MVKINIQGTIFGSTGYDIHTRQLANALHEEGCDVFLQVPLPQNWERAVNDAELLMIKRGFQRDGTTLAIMMPPVWRLPLSDKPKHFIGYCVWEGDKIPLYWLKYLLDNRVDKIFVPSKHTKDAIIMTTPMHKELYMGDKIEVIPHGINPSLFPQKEEILKGGVFTFLANKGWPKGMYDRGGMQYLLKAYMAEFTNKDDVQLNIKINPAYNQPGWDFVEMCKNIGIKKTDNAPKLAFNVDLIDYKLLHKFYHQGDVFVAPTMGEAFGLPMIEAMSCGLPVITTNFGGQTDFVNEENGWLIDYELKHHSNESMYEETKWAIPNIDHLQKIMREIYENQDSIKDKSKKAIEKSKEITWRNTAKKVIKIIEELNGS